MDKKLNTTLNKISNESKIVSTDVDKLTTQVSNALKKKFQMFL